MLYIHHTVRLNEAGLSLNDTVLFRPEGQDIPEQLTSLYRQMGISYPKFFKMDLLSKAAFIAAEVLVQAVGTIEDKDHVATIMTSQSGCMDVDERFEASREEIPSPALFVYTLPNIMLGELCIRHQFKGEQLCTLAPTLDLPFTEFYLNDLIRLRKASACLCGYAEAYDTQLDVRMIWVSETPGAQVLNCETMTGIFT